MLRVALPHHVVGAFLEYHVAIMWGGRQSVIRTLNSPVIICPWSKHGQGKLQIIFLYECFYLKKLVFTLRTYFMGNFLPPLSDQE